jgi:hypothetical protein
MLSVTIVQSARVQHNQISNFCNSFFSNFPLLRITRSFVYIQIEPVAFHNRTRSPAGYGPLSFFFFFNLFLILILFYFSDHRFIRGLVLPWKRLPTFPAVSLSGHFVCLLLLWERCTMCVFHFI